MELTAIEAIKQAISLADLGALPEGPKGQLEAIGLAQAYALISIAQSLNKLVALQEFQNDLAPGWTDTPEPIHWDENGNTGEVEYDEDNPPF